MTPFNFLALGDSYTIGESVQENERWPVQLVSKLKAANIKIIAPKIIATTGWTTDELIAAIDKQNIDTTYSMVSLLIGVNNQYRGYPLDQYKREFEQLLDQAIGFADKKPENVFVISIPDYGVTPFAMDKNLDASKIALELNEYNSVAKNYCVQRGVSFTDITPNSREAKHDATLVASDGLHPSSKMYTEWVNQIYTSVFDNLSSR